MIFLKKGDGGITSNSYVDCGQIRTVDKEKRLITKLGALDKSTLNKIDIALKVSLAIE